MCFWLPSTNKVRQEYRYHDHWINSQTFHWQSQNSTTFLSKRGHEIINHKKFGISIYLFVRDGKLHGNKAPPFISQGKATYQSYEGSKPMSVIFIFEKLQKIRLN